MRMSASSSTIRMSCAMADRTQLRGGEDRTEARRGVRIGGEHQPDAGAALFPISQHQLAVVIFHDLFHDSETQAGALRASRDVGLGQALAALLRQPFTIVLDA